MLRKKSEVSQGAVEFALVLPVLLLILFGIMEMGHLVFIYVTVLNAAREAARYGSVSGTVNGAPQFQDCSGITNEAIKMNTFANFNASNVVINYDQGVNSSTKLSISKVGPCSTLNSSQWQAIGTGDRILVTVTSNYSPLVPLVPFPSFQLTATSAHTIINSISIVDTVVAPPTSVAGPPVIVSVSPPTGSTGGGDSVTINGTGFAIGATTVTFPGASCSVNSTTQIICTTTSHAQGPVDLSVSTAAGASDALSGFIFVTPPSISSISPTAGDTAGNTSLTINGNNFTAYTSNPVVTLDNVNCLSLNVVSNTRLICVTPPHALDKVNVVVSATSNVFATLALGYQYVPRPTIDIGGISPTIGTDSGGTLLTISGTNFLNTTIVTTVTIGGSACLNITVLSGTQLTCNTPAHADGIFDVVVGNSDPLLGGLFATATGAYTYVPSPTITSISPSVGSKTTPTAFIIRGTNFTSSGTTVKLASVAISCTYVSATQLNCTAPTNNGAGTFSVDVTVTNPSGSFLVKNGFTYADPPTIVSVTPSYGPAAGGTTLLVTGTNLTFATITIGGKACTNPTVLSSTQISCSSPSGTINTSVSVVATVTNVGAFTLNNGFYYTSVTVTSISPLYGPLAGGTVLTITGSNFVSGSTSVSVGGNACTSLSVITTSKLTCATPSALVTGPVTVSVTTTTGGTAPTANAFIYTNVTITGMTPRYGPVVGNTTVSISGTNFTGLSSVTFEGIPATNCNLTGSTLITCTTPPQSSALLADLAITTSAGNTATIVNYFAYTSMTITSIVPNYGPVTGSTPVTINGTNLTGMSSVTFGSNTATNCVVNGAGTQITGCLTPAASTAGVVDVTVNTSTNGSAIVSPGFTYTSVTVSNITPSSGPSTGNTPVTITGTNMTGITQVSFGGVAVTCTSTSTSISCTTPANSAGTVDVVITTANGPITKMGAYTYTAPCTIAGISPTTGPVIGGSMITPQPPYWNLAGTNFINVTSVTFGGVSAGISCSALSGLSITCTSVPAHPAGAVAVVINTSNNGSCSLPAGFTYAPAPGITSVTSAFSGTELIIVGQYLNNAIVQIAATTAPCTVDNDNQITCLSPGHATGTVVTVTVISPSGQVSKQFTY